MRQGWLIALGFTGGIAVCAIGLRLRSVTADVPPPAERMFYAGELREGGAPATGPRDIEVRFHSAATGSGNQICTSNLQANTPLVDGHFRINVGAACVTALAAAQNAYVEVVVGGVSLPPSTTPRPRVAAVPYAAQAEEASGARGPLASRLQVLEAAASNRNFRVGATITTTVPITLNGQTSSATCLQTGANDATTLANDIGASVTPAHIACEGTSGGGACPTGVAEQLGIVFTVPAPGDYEVCAAFSATIGISSPTDYLVAFLRLNETGVSSSTPQTIGRNVQRVGSNASPGELTTPFHLCETFTFASAGEKSVRLFENHTGSGVVRFEVGAGAVRFDVRLASLP